MNFPRWATALFAVVAIAGCKPSGGDVDASHWPPPNPAAVLFWKEKHADERYLVEAAKADRIEGWMARCLAYPDLPGNTWPVGSAQARCRLLVEEQQPSLKEITATLATPDGPAKLDRQYAEILDAHYRDPKRREAIFVAFQDFRSTEGGIVAKAWLQRAPHSAYAQMAMGRTLLASAEDVRGGAWISEVPRKDIAAMVGLLKQARPLLKAAFAGEPRLSPACTDLLSIGELEGDGKLEAEAAKECVEVDPLSWHVNHEWLNALDPRWGGSFVAMDRAIAQIGRHVKDNPALGGLLTRAIGLRSYEPFLVDQANLHTIAPQLERVAMLAPDPQFIGSAGMAAAQNLDRTKALVFLSQALRLAPADGRLIIERARVRLDNDDTAGALDDARRALPLVNDDCSCSDYEGLGEVFEKLGKPEEMRATYRLAMTIPSERESAYTLLCRTYVNGMFERQGALDCSRGLISEFRDDPKSLYIRAIVLYMAHDPGADAVAAHFNKVYDPKDEDQSGWYEQLRRAPANPYPYPNGGSNKPEDQEPIHVQGGGSD